MAPWASAPLGHGPLAARALPVLVVCATGLRCAGLVVLGLHGDVQAARLLYLRSFRTTEQRLSVLEREVEGLLRNLNVEVVVVKAAPVQHPRLRELRRALAGACLRRSAWLRELPIALALRRLGAETRDEAALRLAADHPELAAQLDFSGPRPLGSRDREREVRTLVDAFLLARAVAAEARPAGPAGPAPTALCTTPFPVSR